MFSFSEPRTDALIRVLREHPEGVTLVQIAAHLRPLPPRRTLQRWLAKLVFAGQVERRGFSTNTRYFAGDGRVALPIKKRAPKPPLPAPDPAPEPTPKPSRLPPEYQRLFDRLAPRIIRLGFAGDTANYELGMGAAKEWPGCDVEVINGFLFAAQDEFDHLDRETALAKYDVTLDQWNDWRKEWCLIRDLPPDK